MIFSYRARFLPTLIGTAFILSMVSSCSQTAVRDDQDSIDVSSLSQEQLVFRYIGLGESSKLDELLTSNPALVNIYEDTYYNTPLHVAALRDDWACVKVLLAHGADPNLENENGEIPAEIALQDAHLEMSRYLQDVAAGK